MPYIFGIFQIILAALSARFIGRHLLSEKISVGSPVFRAALDCALGLILLSHLLFCLVLLPLPNQEGIYGVFLLTLVLGLLEIYRIVKGSRGKLSLLRFDLSLLAALAFLTYLMWLLLSAALPASERDELIYQLAIPQQLLRESGYPLFQDNIYAYFPQLGNMLMMLGLGVGGEFAAKLFHILSGVLLSIALYGFSEKHLSRGYRYLVLVLFLSVPSVMVVLPLAYVDVTYTLYVFLGMVCWYEALSQRDVRYALLAGFLTGAATAVKYTGFQFLLLMLLVGLCYSLRLQKRPPLKLYLCLIGAASLVGLPYIVRNIIVTGWPLFPFSLGSLELNPLIRWSSEQASLFLGWLGTFGTSLGGSGLLEYFGAPIRVFIRGAFNDPARYDGVIGPVFLLIPFFWKAFKKDGAAVFFALFSLLFLFFWMVTTKQIRFLVPLLPALCFLLVLGIQRSRQGRWLSIFIIPFVAFSLYQGVGEVLKKSPNSFWQGRESRDNYLRRQLPVYSIYQATAKELTSGDKVLLLNMKNYGYYLEVDWTSDFVFERFTFDKLLEHVSEPSEIVEALQDRGISHVLVDDGFIKSSKWGIEKPRERALYAQFEATHLRLVRREGAYLLYELLQ